MDRTICIIAHNIRSTHNIGSLFRTAEGLGVQKLFLTGYSPFPISESDTRLPYIAQKMDKAIDKTALGSQKTLVWEQKNNASDVIKHLKRSGYTVVGLEQTEKSTLLADYSPPKKIALVLGNERTGIEPEILKLCDCSVQIPMLGAKESFNVVQAAAMALYALRFIR